MAEERAEVLRKLSRATTLRTDKRRTGSSDLRAGTHQAERMAMGEQDHGAVAAAQVRHELADLLAGVGHEVVSAQIERDRIDVARKTEDRIVPA